MRSPLWLAGASVVVANAVALYHGARNQWGPPEAEVEMTEREVRLNYSGEDNSGISLWINWAVYGSGMDWLDPARTAAIGFPGGARDWESANRIPLRAGYVALEYDGASWSAWKPNPASAATSSRLVPVDADADPARLRLRHPDRGRVIILHASFRVYLDARNNTLRAGIARLLPASVSVSPGFRGALTAPLPAGYPRFAVRLAVGRDYEPYVTGVRKLPAAPAAR